MARKRARKRDMYIKIRVVLTRPMSRAEAIKLARRTVATRIVPEGLELAWIDWRRGRGYTAEEGSYIEDEAYDALVDFYGVLRRGKTKVAVVSE
ncbi:MAG: hypothetical protein V3T65_06970 [Acidobacteriota bacterium]